MRMSWGRPFHLLLIGLLIAACERADDPPTLFERLAPSATGVTFENRLPEDSSVNILNFLYYYNGGGVAAGDVERRRAVRTSTSRRISGRTGST